MTDELFTSTVWDHYNKNARQMPWREAPFDPYKILVSEVMLQQTQVERVIPKYNAFIARFPDIASLASARLSDVLDLWSGLGYNRRAKYLHDAAKELVQRSFPDTIDGLMQLKGIGKNTAAAVLVYSFNQPHVFIETNIRTVYTAHFFADCTDITEKDFIEKLISTIDRQNPREWYWALMDYGSYLKKQGVRNISQSKGYKKQAKFQGSLRQIRGEVLRQAQNGITEESLYRLISDDRAPIALASLIKDGLVRNKNGFITIQS